MLEARGRVGATTYIRAGSGSPVILVHGVGMDASIWAPQIEALAPSHDVVALDMLGHGGSALPPVAPSLRDYSGQILALMDALDLPAAAVIGHSMGALVALAFALDHPGRVDRFVALNAVFNRTPEQREAVRRRANALDASGPAATVESTIARWFGDEISAADAPKAARIRELLSSVDPVGYARTYRLFATADAVHAERLPGLAMPALFMTGELDPNSSPDMSLAMARTAPFGRAEILPRERHMMSFVSPELVNSRLRTFLEAPAAALTERRATSTPRPSAQASDAGA